MLVGMKRADIEQRLENSCTALMMAAKNGHADTVTRLLALNADVNAMSRSGETALSLSISNGQVSMPKLLLAHGANPALARIH